MPQFMKTYCSDVYENFKKEFGDSALDDLIAERKKRQDDLDEGVRKLGIQAAADVRTVGTNIIDATKKLHDRAGYTFISFGAKTDYHTLARPTAIIPEAAEGFCEQVFGMGPDIFALRLETFLLHGGKAALEVEMKEARTDVLRASVREQLRISFGMSFSLLSCSDLLTYLIVQKMRSA